jgi:hypothetical protein
MIGVLMFSIAKTLQMLDPSSVKLSLKLYLARIEYQRFENDAANAMLCMI